MRLTLDSNVLVYALAPPLHKRVLRKRGWRELSEKASILFEDIIKGKHRLVIPYSVPVEIAAVVAILTGDEAKGKEAASEVMGVAEVVFYDERLAEKAIEHAVKIRASGFDNIVATTAILGKATLLTNDRIFYEKMSRVASEYGVDVKLFRELQKDQIKALS